MFKFLTRTNRPSRPSETIGVTPPSTDARALLARVAWASAKRLDGLLQGNYQTLFRGTGLTLADIRQYAPGDDVRYIDWNVTARMQAPHVREHEEDRELAAWFLIDLSASVDFGSGHISKREVAGQAVATLGRLLQQHGNRLGAILHRGHAQFDVLPARNSRRHLLHMLQQIFIPSTQPTSQLTDLSELLMRANRIIKRRSAIFILSDFYASPGWDKALRMLARRHDVVAIRLTDPFEQSLPEVGMLTMRDAETGEQVFVDTGDPRFLQRFNDQTHEHERALMETFTGAGVDCLELSTEEAVQDGLIRFIHERQRMMRQASPRAHHHG
jgi:uncharacterized protein (DUF58 family)